MRQTMKEVAQVNAVAAPAGILRSASMYSA